MYEKSIFEKKPASPRMYLPWKTLLGSYFLVNFSGIRSYEFVRVFTGVDLIDLMLPGSGKGMKPSDCCACGFILIRGFTNLVLSSITLAGLAIASMEASLRRSPSS